MKEKTIESCRILIGSCVINFLLAGAARLSSIYFVESISRYDVNRKQASFPFVLCFMLRNVSGPLIGYMEQIFGIELLTVVGSVLATVGVGACFFAEDIVTVTVLWGIIFGLSFGFATQLIPAFLNSSFHGNKSKAISIFYAASSVGGFVLPLIVEQSIFYYGFSGSFLIVSAILANSIPAALLLCHLSNTSNHKNNFRQSNTNKSNAFESTNQNSTGIFIIEVNYNGGKISERKTENSDGNKQFIYTNATNNTQINPSNKCSDVNDDELRIDSLDSHPKCLKESSSNKGKFSLHNFSIFINPAFIVLLIMHGISTMVIVTMWTIILDFVRDKGVDGKYEIYYVVCLPIADMAGRFFSGFIIDKAYMTQTMMSSVCFMSSAVMLILFIFAKNHALLIILEIVVSLFTGTIMILQVALTHEFIEEKKRKMAMSCRLMLFGILSLLISPMIGYFRENYGSYDGVFYTMFAMSVSCGCLVWCLPYVFKGR